MNRQNSARPYNRYPSFSQIWKPSLRVNRHPNSLNETPAKQIIHPESINHISAIPDFNQHCYFPTNPYKIKEVVRLS